MSDIRVFVVFPNSGGAVFAGEKLECKIIFRNVSMAPGNNRAALQPQSSPHVNGYGDRRAGGKASAPQLSASDRARSSAMSPRIPQGSAGHKPSLSLSVTSSRPKQPAVSTPPTTNGSFKPGHKHQRSVSVMSIGSEAGDTEVPIRSSTTPQVRVPIRGRHGRSASLQYPPPRIPSSGSIGGAPMTPGLPRTTLPSTPTIKEPPEPINTFSFPARKSPVTPGTPQGPWGGSGTTRTARHSQKASLNKNFQFPPVVTSAASSRTNTYQLDAPEPQSAGLSPNSIQELGRKVTNIDLRSPLEGGSEDEHGHPRFPPSFSVNGDTPRSSGEFYSLTNSTTETLVSDYDGRFASGRLLRPTHSRRHSLLAVGTRPPEMLMMGYAQVMGSFLLDGSLVQTAQFEEVKRKGVVGSQGGGGVVGLEAGKNDGRLLSGFGWGSFGGAIGSLLGSNNMSSIAEMKTIAKRSTNLASNAGSRSIPILSTPQSILFVDLQLGPGDSRSYNFSFPLPRGLPPSHRGKAIKVSYVLKIGTQRAGKGAQQPKVVEIPFRVFPYVDSNGSFRSHDLMSPIVLLREKAVVTCVEETPPTTASHIKPAPASESSLNDFMSYVDTLLVPQAQFLSPSSTPHGQLIIPPLPTPIRGTMIQELSSRENIEMALLQGSSGNGYLTPDSRCSIFEICRNGHKVASLTLARPAYKLGDTIIAVLDFANAVIPCYHIHATLESSESVIPSLALRSPASILRYTRKVHAAHSESCLFAQRIQFAPTIPTSASPEFTTSCISLTWRLNIEFITPAVVHQNRASSNNHNHSLGGGGGGSGGPSAGMVGTSQVGNDMFIDTLLEQMHVDDRGELYEAKQAILVESFDAHIPIKVYPNANVHDLGMGSGGMSAAGGGHGGGGSQGGSGLGIHLGDEGTLGNGGGGAAGNGGRIDEGYVV